MNAPVPPYVLRDEEPHPGEDMRTPEQNRRTILFTLGGIAAAAFAIYMMTHLGAGTPEKIDVDQRQAVSVFAIQPRPFQPVVTLSGEARPVRDIHVVAPTSGVRILELLADEGQTVRAGQPLARLDTAVANAQISAAQAAVAEARSAAIRARDEYNRAEAIRDSGALSAEQIGQRRAAADAADARLTAAQAQAQEANARLAGGYVRAPIAGLVIDRNATLGAPVDGQTLFRIAGGNELEVSAQIAEADILALRDGQTATFRLVDGTEVTGRLRRTAASIDPRTRTGEALFALPRESAVRAGMYLRGEAVLAARTSLAAPQASVVYESGNAYVFVVDAQGVARRTQVQLGQRANGWIEITGGLAQGARVAGSGAAFLKDGDPVRAVSEQPQAPPPPERRAEGDLRGRQG